MLTYKPMIHSLNNWVGYCLITHDEIIKTEDSLFMTEVQDQEVLQVFIAYIFESFLLFNHQLFDYRMLLSSDLRCFVSIHSIFFK